MTHAHPARRYALALVACLLATLTACTPPSINPAPPKPQARTDSSAVSAPPHPPKFPTTNYHPPTTLTINREAGTIDLPAVMVPVKPEWLELIATTKGENSREHEAIVTLTAKPSEIHLALLTLGLEPGHPLINRRVGDQFITDPPTGPVVKVFFIYQKDGQFVQTPAHHWVLNQQTGQPLADTPWLFAGSQFRQWQGKEYYMADGAGNAVSLVNFGDDLIVRQTDINQDTDGQALQINEALALPYGSPLTLRIQATPPPKPPNTP